MLGLLVVLLQMAHVAVEVSHGHRIGLHGHDTESVGTQGGVKKKLVRLRHFNAGFKRLVVRSIEDGIVITYDVLQEPALAGLKVSRLGFDEDTDAALLVEFKQTPASRLGRIGRIEILHVDVTVNLKTALARRHVAHPDARGISAGGSGGLIVRNGLHLGRITRGRRRDELAEGVGNAHEDDAGKHQGKSERHGRHACDAQTGELACRSPAGHRIDGGQQRSERHHFVDAGGQCEGRKRERLHDRAAVGHVVELADQIKEGKERNQCDQHEARREENFLGQLAGNDAHLSSPSKKSGDDANTRGCTRREAISSCRRDE